MLLHGDVLVACLSFLQAKEIALIFRVSPTWSRTEAQVWRSGVLFPLQFFFRLKPAMQQHVIAIDNPCYGGYNPDRSLYGKLPDNNIKIWRVAAADVISNISISPASWHLDHLILHSFHWPMVFWQWKVFSPVGSTLRKITLELGHILPSLKFLLGFTALHSLHFVCPPKLVRHIRHALEELPHLKDVPVVFRT